MTVCSFYALSLNFKTGLSIPPLLWQHMHAKHSGSMLSPFEFISNHGEIYQYKTQTLNHSQQRRLRGYWESLKIPRRKFKRCTIFSQEVLASQFVGLGESLWQRQFSGFEKNRRIEECDELTLFFIPTTSKMKSQVGVEIIPVREGDIVGKIQMLGV